MIDSKNKKFQGRSSSEVDLKGLPPLKMAHIHEATSPVLKMLVGDMEYENSILKERIKELENTLIPPPIFASLIATDQPWRNYDGTQESSSKFKGTSSLLIVVRRYFGENIKKRMSLILEAWELDNSYVSLGLRTTNLRQYLQADLENDEELFRGVVSTFVIKVSNMNELKIKEEYRCSIVCIKQLKTCWIKIINF
jgi:hypothetical protein